MTAYNICVFRIPGLVSSTIRDGPVHCNLKLTSYPVQRYIKEHTLKVLHSTFTHLQPKCREKALLLSEQCLTDPALMEKSCEKAK